MRRGYISRTYPDVIFDPEEEKFLAKARSAAYEDELHPNRYRFLDKARRLMREWGKHGSLRRLPLILSESYEDGREAAQRRMESRERR